MQQRHELFLREFNETLAEQNRQQRLQRLYQYWRGLVEQRDECERRIKAKHRNVTKRTRKRLATLRKEVREVWRQIGESLERINPEQRSAALGAMARAEQQGQSAFPWQKAVTRLLKIDVLLDKSSGESKILPLMPAGRAVERSAKEIAAMLRAEGCEVNPEEKTATDMVRRFVTKQLRVKLKDDR